MTELLTKQQRWDQRYQQKEINLQSPAYVLLSNQYLLANQGAALDLACGLGANAIFLAEKGYQVSAIDYSETALQKLSEHAMQNQLSIETCCADLETITFDNATYDVIVASYYLQRELFPGLVAALKPGGLLFYQTFSGECIDGAGPENPAYRLQEGELMSLCKKCSVLFYREDSGNCQGPSCFNGEAMIVARKDNE